MADTWYKTEYPYRRKITLTNPDVEVADDSYLIEVDTASFVSAGKCRSDCDDIIFCRADDPNELTRYILPGSENTATTSIYVRVKSLGSGDTDIYMYYGSGRSGANQALVEYYKELKGSVDVSGMGAGYYRDIYKSVIETPDGVNMVFTVEDGAYLADSLAVYLNGQQLRKNLDFEETDPESGTFTFLLVTPVSTDEIWTEYYADSATPYAPATPYWSTFTADTGSVTADSLADSFKFIGSGGISTAISGGKQVIIDLATPSSDELVKVSENDTTAGYLNGKLVAGDNITLTEGSDGGNETLTIASTGGGGGGAWEIIEAKTVSGSAVQQVDFTSIAGNDYYEMALTWKILNSGSQANYYLFLNGDSTITNYYRQTFACNASSISTTRANDSAILTESNNCWAAGEVFGIKKIGAKATFEGRTNFLLTTNVRHYMGSYRYTPDLSGSEITAMRIYGDQANCIGIGSEFVLMGLKK